MLARWLWPEEGRARVERLLCLSVCVFAAYMAFLVVRRVVFPWDFYLWSESPFMTNMMKISAGDSAFDPPSDANSFVYSPGLEYLCYALLRPFSLQLDVRACRALSVIAGVVASGLLGATAIRIWSALNDGAAPSATFRLFAFAFVGLVLFRNATADVLHPDNLFILHGAAWLYLVVLATERGSFRLGVAAVVLAGLGALAKQTAAPSFLGAAGVLFVVQRNRWSVTRRLALVVIGAVVAGASVALLRSHANSRFFLFDLLLGHAVYFQRAIEIMRTAMVYPHRLVLFMMFGIGLVRVVSSPARRSAELLACWAALGIPVAGAVGGYLKVMGTWNNLTALDLWLSVIAVPSMWDLVGRAFSRDGGFGDGTIAAGLVVVCVLFLFPMKVAPSPEQWAFGRAIDAHVRADVAAGRSFLLPHGAAPLIHAGLRKAPLDRSNTCLELAMGRRASLAGTKARIESRHYQRVYMFANDWYPGEIGDAIAREYHEIEVIPGDQSFPIDDYLAGYQNVMRAPVRVMDLNP